ncbi:hypothetical protein BT96DRAFT_924608 [Gymnopus androsaceus JB14]|uniref:Fungal-type protein kinase domain-containing protein n=1 Tax=Gymnopus androsaceus JB14 TaxID=1447944 RepID=A0A6A4H363_9AGAR|nr:hypothetical protein BT96DRAFT_924608 [Gymnopus androsaceus JB14]
MYDSKQLENPGLYLEQIAKEGTIPSNKVLMGCLFTVDNNTNKRQGKRTFRMGEVLYCSNGINGRCSKVTRVTCGCEGGDCDWRGEDGECDWKGLKLVMKHSCPIKGRIPEHETIKRCSALAVNEHAWVRKHLPHLLGWFVKDFDGNTVQSRVKEKFGADYEERFICGSIQEELCPIMELESPEEFVQAMYDILQYYGHHAPTSGERTGTKPYMAHEQQRIGWTGPLHYRHDLESLFYVILLLVYHYDRFGVKAEKLEFGKWFTEGDEYLYDKKYVFLHQYSWIATPRPFFAAFRYWLQTIQDSLMAGFLAEGLALRKARAGGQISFDLETLGDNFSYKTMSTVMRNFDGKALVTRNPKWQVE